MFLCTWNQLMKWVDHNLIEEWGHFCFQFFGHIWWLFKVEHAYGEFHFKKSSNMPKYWKKSLFQFGLNPFRYFNWAQPIYSNGTSKPRNPAFGLLDGYYTSHTQSVTIPTNTNLCIARYAKALGVLQLRQNVRCIKCINCCFGWRCFCKSDFI